MRFSLATLLGVVLLVGVGCAALAQASRLVSRLTVTGTLGILVLAVAAAVYLPGRCRAFAGGLAICGWGYLVVSQAPWLEDLNSVLLTNKLVDRLEVALAPAEGELVIFQERMERKGFLPDDRYTSDFERIGHSCLAIVLGCIGGAMAVAMDAIAVERRRSGTS